MTIWRLVIREAMHRMLNFSFALLSVIVAVGSLVAMLTVLDGFDLQTDELLAAKQTVVEERGNKLKDDYRKITKGLGFNILILPQDQNLGDVYDQGYAAKTMPEEYVTRLANSKAMTVNHLLPILERKILWPEQNRTIVLIGTRGEVPFKVRQEMEAQSKGKSKKKKPLLDPVPPDHIVLGFELHSSLKLSKDDEIEVMGKKFKVFDTYAQRGNKDDISAWINLAQAQELLEKPKEINAIWALECNCETLDRLAEIREEIASILPQTQVIEMYSSATARAEARVRAVREAEQAVADEKTSRNELRAGMETMMAGISPVVLLASAIWIGLLALTNVRDRRSEIGILRAIGLRANQILMVFLGKATTIGVLGTIVGIIFGIALGYGWTIYFGSASDTTTISQILSNPVYQRNLGLILIGAPLVVVVASWLPSLMAAQQDPADILCED